MSRGKNDGRDERTTPVSSPERDDVGEAAKAIERTRADLSTTIGALEQRLSPSELGRQAKVELDHVEARVKAAVKESLGEAKSALHDEIVEVKGAVNEQLHEAKEIVTQGLADARETVKRDIQTAITATKQSVRDATLGRVEDIATNAGDFMNTTRDTLVETVRQNPIPAALAGIGIAWLLMNRSSAQRRRIARAEEPFGGDGTPRGQIYAGGRDGGVGSAAGRAMSEARQGVGDALRVATHGVGSALGSAESAVAGAAHDATTAARHAVGQGVEQVGHLAHDARDATGHMLHGAAGGAMRAERAVERTYQSNPIALGVVAVAAGAAIGYSLPRTHKEDELMGDAGHRLLDSATHMAEGAMQSLQHMAGDAGHAAKEAIGAATK